MPFVFHCVFFPFLNLQKNVPPLAPVMANGKKPYERQFGPGQRKSAEPMNLLIIEKEDEPFNSKSYNSMEVQVEEVIGIIAALLIPLDDMVTRETVSYRMAQ